MLFRSFAGYIKVNPHKMIQGTTTLATSWPAREPWQVRVLRVLLWLVPRANPDNEPHYSRVRQWALELDERNRPVREVGLGEGGKVLFRAPNGRNVGFWTDSSEPFPLEEFEAIDGSAFAIFWSQAPNHED